MPRHAQPQCTAMLQCSCVGHGVCTTCIKIYCLHLKSFPFWGHAMSPPASVHCNAATQLCWAWSVHNLHQDSECLHLESVPFWGHAMSPPASVHCNAATQLCWAWSVYNLHLGSDCLRFKASPFGAMPCHAQPQCAATLQQSCVGHGVCTICI